MAEGLSFSRLAAPATLPLRTDLRTRLSWGLALRLQAPDDAMRARVLQRLAHERGYSLSPELLHYLLTHLSRDLSQLGFTEVLFPGLEPADDD